MNLKIKKPNGHIDSYEIERFYDWLLEDEKEKKPAVLNWTSGLARCLGYIIERYYRQIEKPKDSLKYKETFSSNPFMCSNCLKEQKELRMVPPP